MTRGRLLITLAFVAAGTTSCVGGASYDVVLYGGVVVDGSGSPPRVADIGIVGGRIDYVDTRRLRGAALEIDASGLVITPGFVEMHGHLEPRDEWSERARAWLRQGVTLVALGAEGTIPPGDMSGVAEELALAGSPASFALYTGGGAATAAAIDAALDAGAIGIARHPGASPVDSPDASPGDSPSASPGGASAAPEDDFSMGDLRRLAARAGVLFADNIYNPIEEELAYDGGTTVDLRSIIRVPPAMLAAGFDLADALAAPATRQRIRRATETATGSWLADLGYEGVRITSSADHPHLVGQSLMELARANRRTPFDEIAELLIGGERTIGVSFAGDGDRPIRDLPTGAWDDPRAAGLFARVVHQYVRELQLTSLEEAVRRMSAEPAARLGLEDRGRIAPGFVADVVAFELDTVRDHATWAQPRSEAAGVVHCFVNGVAVIRDGRFTGQGPGRFVTRRVADPEGGRLPGG